MSGVRSQELNAEERKKTATCVFFAVCTEWQKECWTMFSSLSKKDKNVLLPTVPCGLIKNEDAKDSLIRFFNYWGFTSPSIVAQLKKLIKN